jgi:hypothetical protein
MIVQYFKEYIKICIKINSFHPKIKNLVMSSKATARMEMIKNKLFRRKDIE